MSSRKGDWLQTYTGGRFWPLDPRPEEVKLEDIAHALSLVCRFAGHTKHFYSVAQHSVLVSRLFPDDSHMALWGLMHDAPEAYIGDITRPLKQYLMTYESGMHRRIADHEDAIMEAVAATLNLCPYPNWDKIKDADNVLLATEARDLMSPLDPDWHKWIKDVPTMPETIEPWSPDMAEVRFIRRYQELKGIS